MKHHATDCIPTEMDILPQYPYTYCYAYCVAKPRGRRLVVPDIHGCYASFSNLLDAIALTKDDQLFLLGDYIDRGPQSARVIEKIIRLQRLGYQIHPLRGNHEQMLLETYFEAPKRLYEHLMLQQAIDLLDDSQRLSYDILYFLLCLPFFIELDCAILVHGGIDPNERSPFEAFDKLLWTRDNRGVEPVLKGKKLIHGHTPRLLFQIREAIEKNAPIINLDNGCVFTDSSGETGNLLCYDIDRNELVIIQPNLDAVSRY